VSFRVTQNGSSRRCIRHGNLVGANTKLSKKLISKVATWSVAFPVIFVIGTAAFIIGATMKYFKTFHDLPMRVWNDAEVVFNREGK
jgi:hypothetical protein